MISETNTQAEATTIDVNMKIPVSILTNHFDANPNSLEALLKIEADNRAHQIIYADKAEAAEMLAYFLLQSAKGVLEILCQSFNLHSRGLNHDREIRF